MPHLLPCNAPDCKTGKQWKETEINMNTNTDVKTDTIKNSGLRKKLSELAFYMVTLVSVTVIWCIVLKIWRADFHIPFDYGTELGNDALGASTWIKSYLQNGFSWEQSDFSVPFSTDRKAEFGVDRIVLLLEILLSRLFSSYGSCLNALYLLSFLITGIAAAYSLRCMRFSREISLSGAVIYTFLQYHMMRGEMHLYLSFYYSAPLAVLIMLWLTDESLLTERFSRCALGRIKRGQILFGFFSWIIGLQQPYYAFFAAIGIAFALFCSLLQKKISSAWESAVYLSIIAFTTLAGNIDALLNASDLTMQYLRQQRTVGGVEFYGLKIINLLLPVQNHRLPVLAKLRQRYDILVGAGDNEAGWVSLGLLLAICLCVALVSCLVHDRADRRLKICGRYILVFLLISTVGGGSSFIGLIFPFLRCYNRTVIFIAMFCVISFAVLAEKIKNLFASRGILILLTLFALWDQTTCENIFSYDATEKAYTQDREFIQAIEAIMPEGACIFELPTLPTGTTSVRSLKDNELCRPYLHARSTRWLHMYSVGSRTDRYVTLLHGMPLRMALDVMVCCGFEGIYIDSRGYSPEQWQEVTAVMDSIGNTTAILSADAQQIFYSLTDHAADLRERLGEEKLRQYADFWLNCPDITCFSASALPYTEQVAPRGDGIALPPGCMQYGPYISLEPGDYVVCLVGDHLKGLEYDVSHANGTAQLQLQFLSREDESVRYSFHVAEKLSGVEMRCTNGTKDDALLRGLFLFRAEQSDEISGVTDFFTQSARLETAQEKAEKMNETLENRREGKGR